MGYEKKLKKSMKKRKIPQNSFFTEHIITQFNSPTKKVKISPPEEQLHVGVFDEMPTDGSDFISITHGDIRNYCTVFNQMNSELIENQHVNKDGKLIEEDLDTFEEIIETNYKRKLRLEEELQKVEINRNFSELLIDKYKPKTFFDLLTSDNVNRKVLTWLKKWDPLVFKKRRNFKHPLLPFKKILLLAGPPGIGKTTLAHIIAKQVGYESVEINASDDRSKKRLAEIINNVSEKKSVFFNKITKKREKPKLIIIDEIDGAMGGRSEQSAVDSLLKAATFGGFHRGIKNRFKGGKSKSGVIHHLRRPVICICNDLYSPVLRNLRKNCELVRFDNENAKKIVDRLEEICENEKIKMPRFTLSKMVDFYQNDIRSCLNSLQFHFLNFREIGLNNEDKELKEDEWKCGFKDIKKDHKDVLEYIFGLDNSGKHSKDNNVEDFYKYLNSECNNENTFYGAFQNYIDIHYEDYDFTKTTRLLDYTSFVDEMNKMKNITQRYELCQYSTYGLIAFKVFCKTMYRTKKYLKYSSEFWVNFGKQRERENISSSLKEGLSPLIQRQYSRQNIITDLIPYLTTILNPPSIRKNINHYKLLTKNEKIVINNLIDIHNILGTTYKQEINYYLQNNQTNFILTPNVFKLVYDYYNTKYYQVSLGVRKFISKYTGENKGVKPIIEVKRIKPPPLYVKDIISKYKSNNPVLTPSPMTPISATNPIKFSMPHVKFIFKEGYSAAVRTQCTINDF